MIVTAKNKEEAIARIMNGLKCDRAEAENVYAYDVAIEHDEKTEHDLPPDKLAIARKHSHTGTRKTPTAYKFTKRERKPNATKGGLIAEFAKFLEEGSGFAVTEIVVTNKERQIAFVIGEEKFELTLVQKRKTKSAAKTVVALENDICYKERG